MAQGRALKFGLASFGILAALAAATVTVGEDAPKPLPALDNPTEAKPLPAPPKPAESKPEDKPEPKPAGPSLGPSPESKPDAKPEPKAEPVPAPKIEPTPVPKKPEPGKLDLGAGASEIGKKPEKNEKSDKPELPPPPPPAGSPTPTPPPPGTPAAPAPAGGVFLKYKHEVNQTIYYEVDHKVTITTQKNQNAETAKNDSKTVKHYRVISIDDSGNTLMELYIDKVKMSAQFGENDPIGFDSDSSNDPPPQFENVKQVVGKPLARIKVSPFGEILSSIRLNGPAPAGGDGPDADAGNNFLIILPGKPIQVGESWNDKAEVRVFVSAGLTRNVTILRNYELKSVSGGKATISVASTVLTPIKDPKINGQLIQRTPSGTIVFDVEKGAIVSRELKLDKTEIGVFDDNSSMRVVSDKLERLVPRDQALRTAGDPPPRN